MESGIGIDILTILEEKDIPKGIRYVFLLNFVGILNTNSDEKQMSSKNSGNTSHQLGFKESRAFAESYGMCHVF
jgi:hypothetical protein